MNLDGVWQLSCPLFDGSIPMSIPGNFEEPLFEAGLIRDPYYSDNACDLRKFEFTDFTLVRKFEISVRQGERKRLILDGIDGIAEVFLNGRKTGVCRNSFIAHAFELDELADGENELKIIFRSSVEELKKQPLRVDNFSSYRFNAEAAAFRRPAHIWGWDIFPRMALGGIFNGVHIEDICNGGIEEFDLFTRHISGTSADMRLSYKVNLDSISDGRYFIKISAQCGGKSFEAQQRLRSYSGFIHFTVPDAELWWPRRYGTPALYDTRITLEHEGEIVDEKRFDFGIRSCKLIAGPLATESAEPDFQFVVNNRKIRVFGTNHVPLDPLHSRAAGKLDRLFSLVCECGIDMLRVWGGGVYESDRFYDLCDRNGVLVWQDFMMGCAVYPRDEEFRKNLFEEAAFVIRRLRRHPSIVLWAGDNENDTCPSWGHLDISPESFVLTREVLREACRRYDISRPYLPSSPWCSPEALAAAPEGTDPTLLSPEQHLWGPRDYFKSDFYRNTKASFLSEFGYHGCPSAESIARFIPEESRWPLHNDICRYRASNPFLPDDTTNNYRIGLMYDQVRELFGSSVPDNLEDFATASQLVQAEALKYIIELFRMNRKCSGLLWWNLIDGCPQFSDAVVDFYGRKKLAFHILKRLHRKLLISLSESRAWHRRVMAVNDSSETLSGFCRVIAFSTGNTVWEGSFKLAPDSVAELAKFKVCTTEKELYLIKFTSDVEGDGFNHYISGYPQYEYRLFKEEYMPLIFGDTGN